MTDPILGIDTGGTFTDFVWFDGQKLNIHKVLSTPLAPEKAILQGIRELGLNTQGLRIVHGSTVATNAVLEGKGVKLAYITNKGLADVLFIGRQARKELYNLRPSHSAFPLASDHCIELTGRMEASGQTLTPLDPQQLSNLTQTLNDMDIQSVAVNLLHAYANNDMEQAVKQHIPAHLFISLSSDVLPEIKEYERGIATWLNAWIGPKVQGYLHHLRQAIPDAKLSIMQSSGDTIAAEQAGQHAVKLLLSGPAGGLMGASFMAKQTLKDQLLTFDMGGTSTDVALIQGSPKLTSSGQINGLPVAVPMVDMHTIGAGGGSIAWLDEAGLLNVGPESAGASPGPACYGKGGCQATVTDANLVLNRLLPSAFVAGNIALDKAAAIHAITQLAKPLGLSVQATAEGIIQIANEHMAQALRVISIQRGMNPQQFVLTSFGGAGGLHVCALAEALGMTQALVPLHSGVLSAFGMLVTPAGRQVSRTYLHLLSSQDDEQLLTALHQLTNEALKELTAEGIQQDQINTTYSLALRYQGQSSTVDIDWQPKANIALAFHQQHQQRYGHQLDMAIEIVHIRATLKQQPQSLSWQSPEIIKADTLEKQNPIHIYQRNQLITGQQLTAPALIVEPTSTTWLAPNWTCHRDATGHLLLQYNP